MTHGEESGDLGARDDDRDQPRYDYELVAPPQEGVEGVESRTRHPFSAVGRRHLRLGRNGPTCKGAGQDSSGHDRENGFRYLLSGEPVLFRRTPALHLFSSNLSTTPTRSTLTGCVRSPQSEQVVPIFVHLRLLWMCKFTIRPMLLCRPLGCRRSAFLSQGAPVSVETQKLGLSLNDRCQSTACPHKGQPLDDSNLAPERVSKLPAGIHFQNLFRGESCRARLIISHC